MTPDPGSAAVTFPEKVAVFICPACGRMDFAGPLYCDSALHAEPVRKLSAWYVPEVDRASPASREPSPSEANEEPIFDSEMPSWAMSDAWRGGGTMSRRRVPADEPSEEDEC